MPIHDWTRVEAGYYHDFHQDWAVEIRRTLNAGLLPEPYYAMTDKRVADFEPDVIAVRPESSGSNGFHSTGGVAVLDAAPKVHRTSRVETEEDTYAQKSNRISIRDGRDATVAIIELVSPGNKKSRAGFEDFTGKIFEFLNEGVHVLIVDPFPPTRRDPNGLHHWIWEELTGECELPPKDKPLTAVSYECNKGFTSYFEPFAVGDPLPEMPLFLRPGHYIPLPLEAPYQTSWKLLPKFIRELVAGS